VTAARHYVVSRPRSSRTRFRGAQPTTSSWASGGDFYLTKKVAGAFAAFTGAHIKTPLAIVLGNRVRQCLDRWRDLDQGIITDVSPAAGERSFHDPASGALPRHSVISKSARSGIAGCDSNRHGSRQPLSA